MSGKKQKIMRHEAEVNLQTKVQILEKRLREMIGAINNLANMSVGFAAGFDLLIEKGLITNDELRERIERFRAGTGGTKEAPRPEASGDDDPIGITGEQLARKSEVQPEGQQPEEDRL